MRLKHKYDHGLSQFSCENNNLVWNYPEAPFTNMV